MSMFVLLPTYRVTYNGVWNSKANLPLTVPNLPTAWTENSAQVRGSRAHQEVIRELHTRGTGARAYARYGCEGEVAARTTCTLQTITYYHMLTVSGNCGTRGGGGREVKEEREGGREQRWMGATPVARALGFSALKE